MSLIRLVKKEVMAVLKSPAFIVGLVFMAVYFVALGRVIGTVTEQAVREVLETPVGLVNEDVDSFTFRLIAAANITLKGRLMRVTTVEEGLQRFPAVLLIPRGFGSSILGTNATVYIYSYLVVDRASAFQQARAGIATSIASVLTELARRAIAVERGIDISELSKTVSARVETRVGSRVVELGALSSLFGSTMMFAILVGILGMMTLMYSAQSVASEKEEKAFEMLLTLPIKRTTIAVAKIAGAVVVSVLMVVIYFFGFSYMMSSMPQAEQAAGTAQVTWAVWDMFRYLGSDGVSLLVVSLGLMLLFSGAVGLLIGILSSDTRVAGAVSGPIGAVLYVGILATQFIGVPLSAESALLGGTVYGLPLAIVVAYLTGDKTTALLAVGLALTVVAAIVAAVVKVFGSERILIGVSFLRRRRSR